MDIRPDYANVEVDGKLEKVDPDVKVSDSFCLENFHGRIRQGQSNLLLRLKITDNLIDLGFQNLIGNTLANEVENNDIFTDTVQNFWSAKLQLKVFFNTFPNIFLNFFIRHLGSNA